MKTDNLVLTTRQYDHGFTLVELLISVFISLIIMGAIFSAFTMQNKSQLAQEQIIEVQQNIRASLNLVVSETRLAGYDPVEKSSINPGIVTATSGRLRFTSDLNGNGTLDTALDVGEEIEYGFKIADDSLGTGLVDNGDGHASFCRQTTTQGNPSGFQPIADNVVAVEFLYTLEDTTDNGIHDPAKMLTPPDMDDVRAVTISMLARTAKSDRNRQIGQSVYTSASGANWPVNNKYRHRLITTTVQLRNLGL